MALNTAGREALLNTGKAAFTHVGALTDLTGTAVAGARQAITWSAAGTPAAAQVGNTVAINIPIANGETPVALGLYSALTGGTLYGVFGYGAAGQQVKGFATVDTGDLFTSNAHGMTTDDRVILSAVNGEALPTGLGGTTLYYVIATSLTTNTFKIATTQGGAAVDVTVAGEVLFQKTVINTFTSAGNLTLAVNALILDASQV